jgi:type II secretory pathway component PulF
MLSSLPDLPEPYGAAVAELTRHIETGNTLSSGLTSFPDLFPEIYIALIRAGEKGGTLEEVLQRISRLLRLDWQLAILSGRTRQEASLLFRANTQSPIDASSRREQIGTLLIVCETFGVLLGCGVPILQTLGLVSTVMPEESGKAAVLKGYESVRAGKRLTDGLSQSGIFPLFVLDLINSGEESGTLDITLHEAARALAEELELEIGQPLAV